VNVARVRNDGVWQSLKILFMGTALIFLISVYFGFDNSLTSGEIPRWQILIHLHGGSVGWITLSAIGFAIWVLTGNRDVSESYEQRVRWLVWAAVIIFGGYVPTFGLAFSRSGGFLVALLPIFGISAVIVLWVTTVYALRQLRHQPTLTTVHLLAAGALLVAAVGATVGAMLGLERLIGRFLPIAAALAEDRVGAHAAMMDTYLFLLAGAIIEWFMSKGPEQRWSWAGLAQGLAWTIGAILVPIAFFLNLLDAVLPLFGLLLLLGLVLFLVRVAWRAIRTGPKAEGVQPWVFFGTLWLIVYMVLFLYAVVGTGGDFSVLPGWFFALFAHSAFVGMMTNLLMGVQSARAWSARQVLSWGEPAALWIMNLGLLVFVALQIAADIRLGAMVMGIGILLGIFTMLYRLRSAQA
jgi:hypothetical protein